MRWRPGGAIGDSGEGQDEHPPEVAMRVTLLGHASVLVELDGATCLMDPVLADPFEEGTVVSCPQRTIDADRLPPIDILVISHRHPDHFLRVPRMAERVPLPDLAGAVRR